MPFIRFTLMIILFLLSSTFISVQADTTLIGQVDVQSLRMHDNSVLSGGQPSSAQLKKLAAQGVKHIINLRPIAEQHWDEKALVTSLGMSYHHIPVAGAAGVTTDNALQLAQLLDKLSGEPVLLHCASGNRVGALMALSAKEQQGLDADAAIKIGKKWGMTSLERVLRSRWLKEEHK